MAGLFRNTINLLTGNIFAQLLAILSMPIVSRLYTPAEFGIFSMFVSVLTIMAPVCTLRFNEVILLQENHQDAINVFSLGFFSSLICATLSVLPIIAIHNSPPLQQTFHLKEYHNYLLLIPAGILLRGLNLNLGSFAIRQANFKALSILSVLKKFSDRLATIGLGLTYKLGAWGLIIGHLFSALSCALYLVFFDFRKASDTKTARVSLHRMIELAKQYKVFPIYGPWSIMLHTSAKEMVIFVIVSLFSPAIAGAYALGKSMVSIPLNLLGSSLGDVFTQKAVSLKNKPGELAATTTEFIICLSYLFLPPILALSFLGDYVFAVFFGQKWQLAGIYIQILAPSFFFISLYSILRSFFVVFERPQDRLYFDISYFLIRGAGLIGAGIYTREPIPALLCMSLVTCVHIAAFLCYLCKKLERDYFFFLQTILKRLIFLSPFILGLTIARLTIRTHPVISIIMLLLTLLLEVFIVLSTEPQLRSLAQQQIPYLKKWSQK